MLERSNLVRAFKRVVKNGGAPGVDGVTVDELRDYAKTHWEAIREQIEGGSYRPQPARRVEIAKPGGGVRMLGIPTVIDRLIQQALLQVLTPLWDPTFSEASYGFRPRRGAHQAVKQAREHVADGYGWVVDLDLEKFFDRVNHDLLMARVMKRSDDKRVIRLIRSFLNAGVLVDGKVVRGQEGVPQGSPLSPLLANLLLDDLDKELERRGHRFVRYADDCNVYVRSERAGHRVLETITSFLEKKLKLPVNRAKSAVARPQDRQILGFRLLPFDGKVRIGVSPKAVARVKATIRGITRASRGGWSMEERLRRLAEKLPGWVSYYRLAETPTVFDRLDQWLRRRLRMVYWRQWKRPKTRQRELRVHGLPDWLLHLAASRKGPWRTAGSPPIEIALSKAYWAKVGLYSLGGAYRTLRTAG